MFRFWYRFVPVNSSVIAKGVADIAYRRISPYLSDYMGSVFENICMQYLWNDMVSGNCPVRFSSLGRWWGTDPAKREQAEIDIMGEQDKDTALFGECKCQSVFVFKNRLYQGLRRNCGERQPYSSGYV